VGEDGKEGEREGGNGWEGGISSGTTCHLSFFKPRGRDIIYRIQLGKPDVRPAPALILNTHLYGRGNGSQPCYGVSQGGRITKFEPTKQYSISQPIEVLTDQWRTNTGGRLPGRWAPKGSQTIFLTACESIANKYFPTAFFALC
jgi:hypothetical protein